MKRAGMFRELDWGRGWVVLPDDKEGTVWR